MPVSQFMAAANAHYYATHAAIGAAGDFVTAPELSPLFGRALAVQLAQALQAVTRVQKVPVAEARTLATFRHPNIVRVARFFEANRTAYMVLEYEEGEPLKTWWPAHRSVGEPGLVELLLSGCTTVADHQYHYYPGMPFDASAAVFDEAERLGVRMVLCRGGQTVSRAMTDAVAPPQVAPGRLSITASGASVNTSVSRSKPSRYSRQKPTGNSSAPISGLPVWTVTVTANAAASARMAPAM